MAKVLPLVILLLGLTALFKSASEWFLETKNINIVPATLIAIIPVFIFVFNYGSESTASIVWMCIAVAIVLAITVFNLLNYGLKNGALASLAELVFSVAVVLLILCILVAKSQSSKGKKSKRRRN